MEAVADSENEIEGPKIALTITVLIAAIMALIDVSIVNVALSDIRASFGTPLDRIGWVSTGYMMANVVVIPMTGWLQKRFGARPYFTVSIVMFTVTSALCGASWSFPSLVVFRVLQGIAGGAIIPTAQTILFSRYPKSEHAMAGALCGLAAIMGPFLGPTLGGWCIQLASWHWIFYVNVPVGLAAAFLSQHTIREKPRPRVRMRVDAVGIGLLAVGMASLQYVLEEGHRNGWFESRLIAFLAAVAWIALLTFVVHELETEEPVVDLRLFRSVGYSAGMMINAILGVAMFSSSYLFSLYCGVVMGYDALDTGLVFLAAGAVQLVFMPLVGKLGAKVDGRALIVVGLVMMVVALWTNGHLTPQAGYFTLVRPQVMRSMGIGLILVPISVMALSNVPAAQRGNASGLFNLARELGGTIGTAWMGGVLENQIARHGSYLSEHISEHSSVAWSELRAMQAGLAARMLDASRAGLRALELRVEMQALVRAFNDGFVRVSILCATGLVFVVLLRPSKSSGAVDVVH